jgi:hypothetical protein
MACTPLCALVLIDASGMFAVQSMRINTPKPRHETTIATCRIQRRHRRRKSGYCPASLGVMTQSARQALAARFGLPYSIVMQDWEWEVADPARFEEFLEAYKPELPVDQRIALMEILIQCVEDSASGAGLLTSWQMLAPLLAKNSELHAHTIAYWSCLEAEHPEEMWRVSMLMRQVELPL